MDVKLSEKGIIADDRCRQCGKEAETLEHLFFHCNKAILIWKLAPVSWEGLTAHTGYSRSGGRSKAKLEIKRKLSPGKNSQPTSSGIYGKL